MEKTVLTQESNNASNSKIGSFSYKKLSGRIKSIRPKLRESDTKITPNSSSMGEN